MTITIHGATGVDLKDGHWIAEPAPGGGMCFEADGPAEFCILPGPVEFEIPAGRHVKITFTPGLAVVEIT